MVGVVSYKKLVMVVVCRKKDGRETIVDLWDVDIGKAADARLSFELSMSAKSYQQRFEALSLLKFKEGAVFPKCETSEGFNFRV